MKTEYATINGNLYLVSEKSMDELETCKMHLHGTVNEFTVKEMNETISKVVKQSQLIEKDFGMKFSFSKIRFTKNKTKTNDTNFI